MFATLLMAAIGLGIPKIWVLRYDAQIWTWSWVGGSMALGLLIAGIWTYCVRRTQNDAALEIDRRFGLKERISSSLMLSPAESETEARQALWQDASRRVETIDVGEQFHVAPGGRLALPLIPAVCIIGLFVLNNATNQQQTSAATAVEIEKVVKESQDGLKKMLEEKNKEAKEKGLQDAEALFKTLEEAVKKDLEGKTPAEKKAKALVKLNDLAKELQDRKDQLGGTEKVKEQLSKLKDHRARPRRQSDQGPARRRFRQGPGRNEKAAREARQRRTHQGRERATGEATRADAEKDQRSRPET